MTDLFNSNKIYYITLGKDGRYISANNYFRRRFSVLPGMEDAGFTQSVFSADIGLYKETAAACLGCAGKGRSIY